VAPNYRIGVFGFFAHPSLRGTGEGNYSLLDQQAALRWISANVAAFGGDPQRITLFGESAGATSICAHLALPGSQGLFHGAIMQSYTCIFPDAVIPRDEAEQAGLKFASKLGCADPATALLCLRALPVRKLGRAKSQRRGNGGQNGWSPMIGGEVLPRPPRETFARGDGARIPVLIGSNHDEGRLFSNALAFLFIMSSRRGYERSVRNALPESHALAALNEYAEVARGSYSRAFSAILTDSHFACPVLSMHRLLSRSGPMYAYEFDDPHAPSKLPQAPCSPPLGSYHTSELAYVFHRPWALQNPKKFSASQWSLARRIQDHWGTFARTGSPNGGALPTWPVFDGSAVHRLSPDDTSGPADDFAVRHHCAFWNARGY
jgi:para-nitrobenzyl esterase